MTHNTTQPAEQRKVYQPVFFSSSMYYATQLGSFSCYCWRAHTQIVYSAVS